MKIQSLAVVFAIIILPIVIILSYYIHKEIDTITLQSSYDTKLIDSTHDAMAALEINTANEELSSVADSLRSIIEASTNVFFNTLATNLGISNAGNSSVDRYVPAILYTLYDGYYIYAPTRVPVIDTDEKGHPNYSAEGQLQYKTSSGTTTDINDNNIIYTQDSVLKSYMPYSARYKNSSVDVTINYTLDNYLTIEGSIGNIYYTKTGYLIAPDLVQSVTGDITDLLTYNENDAEEKILSGQYGITLNIKPKLEDGSTSDILISYNKIPNDDGTGFLSYPEIQQKLVKFYEDADSHITEIQDLEYASANLSAIAYYVKAHIFSNWIYNNLGTGSNAIRANNIVISDAEAENYSTDRNLDIYYDFSSDSDIIFNYNSSDPKTDPESEDSVFFMHKYNVIKNSIQYNLNLAMSSYNKLVKTLDIQMPVISANAWDQILGRVSVVSFMQGLNCGFKTYNNYAVASSTNNEFTVIPSEIFYAKKDEYNTADESHEYHKIDCSKLDDAEYISFKSKEIKYDKIYDKALGKYVFDHRNLGCYTCAIASNYKKDLGGGNSGYSDDLILSPLSDAKKKAYYIAIGKERQNLYKTNALTDSCGYEILYDSGDHLNGLSNATSVPLSTSSLTMDKVKQVEIIVRDVKNNSSADATVNFDISFNGYNHTESLNLGQSLPQTIVIPVHSDNPNSISTIIVNSNGAEYKVLNVKVIYE